MKSYTPATLQAVLTVAFIMSSIAVGLRIWVRHWILRSFGKDDWAMLLTQIMWTLVFVSQTCAIHYGAGRHIWELSDRNATIALAFTYFDEVTYFLVSILLKTALCLFLLRIAKARPHILILKLMMWSNITIGTAAFFVQLFQCWPIPQFWNIDPASASSCVPPDVIVGLFYALSSLNVMADWTIGTLPFFMLKSLQIPVKQKRIVQGILAFAAIGSTATVVRFPYLSALRDSYSGTDGDFLFKIGGIILWSCVELGIGITAGSVVTLRPLIRLAIDRLSGSSDGDPSPHIAHSTIGGTHITPPKDAYGRPVQARRHDPKAWNGINSISELESSIGIAPRQIITKIEGKNGSHEIARPDATPVVQMPNPRPGLFRGPSWLNAGRRKSEDVERGEAERNLPGRLVVEVDRQFEIHSHIEGSQNAAEEREIGVTRCAGLGVAVADMSSKDS